MSILGRTIRQKIGFVFHSASIRFHIKAKRPRTEYDLDLFQSRLRLVVNRCGGFQHVAEMAGLEPHYLWHYLYSRGPSVDGLFKIASSCGVSLDYLVGRWTLTEFLRQNGIVNTRRKIFRFFEQTYLETVSAEVEFSALSFAKASLINLKIYQKMKPKNWLEDRILRCADEVRRKRQQKDKSP